MDIPYAHYEHPLWSPTTEEMISYRVEYHERRSWYATLMAIRTLDERLDSARQPERPDV